MKLSSEFSGTPLRGISTSVNQRDTMNYAAATGDANPVYFDDDCQTPVMAPPMFCVALTWPVSEHMKEHIESADFPADTLLTQVHYTEHIEIHRPVKPGDCLTISGKIAAILPHRSGTQVVVRFDAVDKQNAPVFTEHIGGLMRGVQFSGEPRGGADTPEIQPYTRIGELKWMHEIYIDPLLPFIYDGCTNIVFPIHTSKKFAHSVGLPGIILQGTATLALATREITNAFADGNPASIKTIACRFTGMVTPGSRIRVKVGNVDKKNTETRIWFLVENEDGRNAVSDGFVHIQN